MNTISETKRKFLHVVAATLFALLLWYVPHPRIILVQLVILGVVVSLLEKKFHIPLLSEFLDALERKKDRKKFPGKSAISMAAGALIAELFFGPFLAGIGMLVLAFGDSTANLVGRTFGKIELLWDARRHLEGRLAGTLIIYVVLLFIFYTHNLEIRHGLLVLVAAITMLIESLPWRKIGLDDNLLLPMIASASIYFLF